MKPVLLVLRAIIAIFQLNFAQVYCMIGNNFLNWSLRHWKANSLCKCLWSKMTGIYNHNSWIPIHGLIIMNSRLDLDSTIFSTVSKLLYFFHWLTSLLKNLLSFCSVFSSNEASHYNFSVEVKNLKLKHWNSKTTSENRNMEKFV